MKILNGKYILFNAIYFAALGCFIHLFVKSGDGVDWIDEYKERLN